MVSAQDPAWRTQLRTASLEAFRGCATALRTSLPHAVRVLDAFHVGRLGQAAVDDVRRRRQQQTLGLDRRTVHWQAWPATPIRGRSPCLVA